MNPVSQAVPSNTIVEKKNIEPERAPTLAPALAPTFAPTFAPLAPAVHDEKAASETAERVRHEDSIQKSRIETELKNQAASSAIAGHTEILNEKNLKKIMVSLSYINLGQREQIKTQLTTGLTQFMRDASPEEKVMLKHMSSVYSLLLIQQPELVQEMIKLQQQLVFATLEELVSAHFAPSIQEYTKEVKALSPQYLEGLCKEYANEESQAIRKQIATCLILFQKYQLSLEGYKAIAEVLDAKDKMATLKQKVLPAEIATALQELFELPAFSDAALDSLKEEIKKKCSAAI